MRGKLERLVGGVLLASAMMLAGCVAQVDDDEEEAIDESSSAFVVEPVATDRGDLVAPRVDGSAATGNLGGTFSGGDNSSDPQPNPWKPGTPAPAPGDPGPSQPSQQR